MTDVDYVSSEASGSELPTTTAASFGIMNAVLAVLSFAGFAVPS